MPVEFKTALVHVAIVLAQHDVVLFLRVFGSRHWVQELAPHPLALLLLLPSRANLELHLALAWLRLLRLLSLLRVILVWLHLLLVLGHFSRVKELARGWVVYMATTAWFA